MPGGLELALFITTPSLGRKPLYFNWFVRDILTEKWSGRERCPIVKTSVVVLIAALTLCGCATSTIQTRKQERSAAYAELPAETRSLVDQGKIKVGMSLEAVYIAWG